LAAIGVTTIPAWLISAIMGFAMATAGHDLKSQLYSACTFNHFSLEFGYLRPSILPRIMICD
jgi:hypothetical protein